MEKRVLVIGDLMLDRHTMGRVSRISPEAPVPVIKTDLEDRTSLGAAANVAAQIAEAGYETTLAHKHFWIGETDPRETKGWFDPVNVYDKQCYDKILAAGINPFPLFLTGVDGPVSIKERIWTGQQQICRVDYEDTRKPCQATEALWIRQLKELIEEKEFDCIVFSDYDKGTLTDRIIQAVTDACDETCVTILDPKRYSYWGLQGLTVIKPNKNEVDITHRSVQELSEELGKTFLLNTLSEDGMKLWVDGHHIHSERVYVEPKDVEDVCGCGDTTTAFLAIAFLRGLRIEQGMKAASFAAAENIKHRGCYVIDENGVDCMFSPTYQELYGE